MKCLDITQKRKFGKSIKKHNPECIISIGSPGTKPPRAFRKSSLPKLRLEFHDVTSDIESSPSEEHIRQLISFGNEHIDKTFVVHCRAGVSRSAACAVVLESLNGQDVKWIYPKFFIKFKRIRPNEKILKLSGLLETKSNIEIYEFWKRLYSDRYKWWYKYF